MRIAFVYDRVNKFGGAERVLLALHQVWPEASLYTVVYNPAKAKWAKKFSIKTSFLNKFPFSSKKHEVLPLFTPFAIESFSFDRYDVVLSLTSSDIKGIITKPGTLHICYCLTPTRYLWSGFQQYYSEPGFGWWNSLVRLTMKGVFPKLRRWDYIAAQRPDAYLAISKTVSQRIKKYYKRDSIVVYPPVDTKVLKPMETEKIKIKNEKFYLIVSRLVPYKRLDYAISAFNMLGWRLKIIGTGVDEKRLKNLAKKNIEFLGGDLTDEKLCWYYRNCQALIFPGVEDFGLTAVEAQACGSPVIAFAGGGVAETIISGKTGELYFEQSQDSLISVLTGFSKKRYKAVNCRKNAVKYSKDTFKKRIKAVVENLWKERKSKL